MRLVVRVCTNVNVGFIGAGYSQRQSAVNADAGRKLCVDALAVAELWCYCADNVGVLERNIIFICSG